MPCRSGTHIPESSVPFLKGCGGNVIGTRMIFNTTVYGKDDVYRGISGERDVVFVNEDDARELGLDATSRVDLVACDDGGARGAEGRSPSGEEGSAAPCEAHGANAGEGSREQGRLDGLQVQQRIEGLRVQRRLDGLQVPRRLDGLRVQRRLNGLRVQPYGVPRGCLATYFPEANVLCALEDFAEGSRTPNYKSVRVRIVPR